MHEMTARLLAKEDDRWDNVTGYVIIWENAVHEPAFHEPAFLDKQNVRWQDEPRSYVWGPGPVPENRANSRGGWTSMRHAQVFPDFRAAMREVPVLKGMSVNGCHDDRQIRIVKVRIQKPVVVLEDHAVDLLQKLAEL